MKNVLLILLLCLSFSQSILAEEEQDTITQDKCERTIHRIGIEFIPAAIIHTHKFLEGNNAEGRTMNHAATFRVEYSFQKSPNSLQGQIYKDVYQGVGLAYHNLNPELGNPISVYIFQGAPIVKFSQRLSLNYEWNLGLSFNWNPYDKDSNPDNRVIGSKVNAYIDVDFYLRWMLSDNIDLNLGMSVSHFSNGNTNFPNAGLNIIGAKLGAAYYINRKLNSIPGRRVTVSKFERHISYDLVLYGSWRKRGMAIDNDLYALHDPYTVFGFNFNPMYNVNPWLKTGLSLDGVYDRSANLYVEDYVAKVGSDDNDLNHVCSPSMSKQMALGISYRAEFVMPYFSINVGLGTNFLNAKNDFSGLYQILALKVNLSRNLFAHIGYSMNNFSEPNHLMLGLGYRFHNKRKSM